MYLGSLEKGKSKKEFLIFFGISARGLVPKSGILP